MSMGQDYVGSSGKITLTASATKSLWLLEPSTTSNIRITGISISMDASSAAAGVQMDLYRVNSLGSAAGTSALLALHRTRVALLTVVSGTDALLTVRRARVILLAAQAGSVASMRRFIGKTLGVIAGALAKVLAILPQPPTVIRVTAFAWDGTTSGPAWSGQSVAASWDGTQSDPI